MALYRRGVNRVVITLGKLGAVMMSAEGLWQARPPAIKVVSAVGSGDSFLGGLVTALARNLPTPEALQWAVATGAANALAVGGGKIRQRDVEALYAQTRTTHLVAN